jgi:iron complex outermembrane receptor protein
VLSNSQPRRAGLAANASMIAITVALGVLGSAGAARAADADAAKTTEVGEVVVTGFRGSLERALVAKRDEVAATDSILAEDIGKFPDLNLSESIQRIPGVALARDGGEGREISVRGLGPQFTRVRIDGMEALTTAGGSDASGGTNRGRAFDFNVFASDLFNEITIRKSAEASTEEGSLGATVDLRTARPFDYHGFTMVGSLQGSYNSLSTKTTPRGSFLIANQWGDGMFGVLFSLAYTKRQLMDNGASTVRWATGNAFAPGFDALPNGAGLPTTVNPAAAAVNAAYHPRFPRFDQYTDDQQRLGGTLSIQVRPDPHGLVTFDALYADFKGTREEQYLEAPSFSVGGACTAANVATTCGIADTNVVSSTIDSHNTLIKGTFNDVDLRVEDRFDQLDTKFTQYSMNFEQSFWDDRLKFTGFLGHSKSDHNNPIQTTVTLDQFNVQGYAYDYSLGRTPLLTYGNAQITNPAAWRLTGIRERPQRAINTYDTASLDAKWGFNDAIKFSGGVDYKKYGFNTTELRRSNGTTSNQEAVVPAALAAIPLSNYTHVIAFNGTGLDMPAGSVLNWLVPNLNVANTVLSLYDTNAFPVIGGAGACAVAPGCGAFQLGPEPALGNNRSVAEKDSGGYLQGDLDTTLNGIGIRANLGIRLVHTNETSTGYTFLSGAPLPITVNHVYNDTLPAFNLVIQPMSNFLIRGSAAKVMSRPDLGSLTPGATVSVAGNTRTVTAGNPNLAPFRANAYDLSFEWYFDKGALLSVALFQKDIGSLVQTISTITTFSGNPFGLPDSVAVAACGTVPGCSPSASWTFSTPVNTKGGRLRGYEINYQQPFRFLPSFLSHTGMLINYTHVSSSINYLNSAGAVVAVNDLTGLSRQSWNGTAYYEDSRLSARVSLAYRSKYLTRVPGQEAGTDVDGTNSTLNVDASLQFTVNRQLKLTLEGINLTDQFQDQFNDSSNRLSFYHHTGREVLFGARFTY